MTVKRLIILQIILILGFGSVFLLPRQGHSQHTGATAWARDSHVVVEAVRSHKVSRSYFRGRRP